jgi:hypothetical protein
MSETETKEGERLSLALMAPSEWDRLPDLGLYMDQVVTFLERELESLKGRKGERLVTPSMINNYAKANIIPRTEGKKYSRQHMALLLSAFILKRVLSAQDIALLMSGLGGQSDTKAFYESLRRSMDQAAKETVAAVREGIQAAEDGESVPGKAYLELALRLAVEASLRSFAAEILLGETEELAKGAEPSADRQSKRKRKGSKEGAETAP